MSQRLGVAAALLGQPKYLLLDEPANGLDPEGIAWLRDFLKNYADEGNAVFVSSHLLSEMSLMADNVVVIGKGKMIASGSIKDILSGNGHASVFVRTNKQKLLEAVLAKAEFVSKPLDGGLTVTGAITDEIGELAFKNGITILELSPRNVSLEDAFLDLTADSQEYQTKKGIKS
jgi:ABC-2 type transport system ATP-binding protein